MLREHACPAKWSVAIETAVRTEQVVTFFGAREDLDSLMSSRETDSALLVVVTGEVSERTMFAELDLRLTHGSGVSPLIALHVLQRP